MTYQRRSNPGAMQQLARYVAVPPIAKTAITRRVMRGTMAQTEVAATGAIVIGMMVLTGAAGYFAGSAMSPKNDKKSKRNWGLAGIPIGFFLGPLGLGGMGLYASRQ